MSSSFYCIAIRHSFYNFISELFLKRIFHGNFSNMTQPRLNCTKCETAPKLNRTFSRTFLTFYAIPPRNVQLNLGGVAHFNILFDFVEL